MRSSWTWGVLSSIAIISNAAPQPDDIIRNTAWQIETVHVGERWVSGPIAYNESFTRAGLHPPHAVQQAASSVHQALRKRESSASAQDIPGKFEREYLSQVTIGADTIMMEFDTTTGDTWMFSSKLPKSAQKGHSVYRATGTPMKKKGGIKKFYHDAEVGPNDGYVYGNMYVDKIQVGDITATMQVAVATSISDSLVARRADGAIGLGFAAANTCEYGKPVCKTFLETPGISGRKVAAVALRRNAPSTWNFDWIDSTSYEGRMQYAPAIDNYMGLWMIKLYQNYVGDSVDALEFEAIVSTASPLIVLPKKITDRYWSFVKGATFSKKYSAWVFPCSSAGSLPSFGLVVDWREVGNPRRVPGPLMDFGPLNDGSGNCYGALQRMGPFDSYAILGTTFMNSQVVAFEGPNRGKSQIGFASQVARG